MQVYCYNSGMSTPSARPAPGFGSALRFYRMRKRMSQAALGEAIGKEQTTISDWEKRAQPPRDFDFYGDQVAALLGVDIDTLQRGEIERGTENTDVITHLADQIGVDADELSAWLQAIKGLPEAVREQRLASLQFDVGLFTSAGKRRINERHTRYELEDEAQAD